MIITEIFFVITLEVFVPHDLYHVFEGGESDFEVKIAEKCREQLSPGPERAFLAIFGGFWNFTTNNVGVMQLKLFMVEASSIRNKS